VLAFGPAGVILLVEILALIYAALGGARGGVEMAIYALWAGAIAGVAAPVAIIFVRRRDCLVWVVASIAATLVALLLGFAAWAGAADLACQGAADCPFG